VRVEEGIGRGRCSGDKEAQPGGKKKKEAANSDNLGEKLDNLTSRRGGGKGRYAGKGKSRLEKKTEGSRSPREKEKKGLSSAEGQDKCRNKLQMKEGRGKGGFNKTKETESLLRKGNRETVRTKGS